MPQHGRRKADKVLLAALGCGATIEVAAYKAGDGAENDPGDDVHGVRTSIPWVPMSRPECGSDVDDRGAIAPDRQRPGRSSLHPSVSRRPTAGARRRRAAMPKTCPVRGRTDRCGAVDVIVSPSAALPDGRTGTGSRIGLVPDRRVIEGSPPDDAGADRSVTRGLSTPRRSTKSRSGHPPPL